MAYTPLTTGETATGEPVTTSLLGKVKDNLADHETRILDIENGTIVDYPPIIMRVNGNYGYRGIASNILTTTTNFGLTITGVRLITGTAGSAGTTEIDIKFKRGAGAFTSVLTTKPSVASSAGDNAVSTNAVLNGTLTTLQAGDLISLDITSVQTNGFNFFVRIDYIKV